MLSAAIQLRDYQIALVQGVYQQWQHHQRVMCQLPTGGGKTVIFSVIADEFVRRSKRVLVLAHREELVLQAASKLESIIRSPLSTQTPTNSYSVTGDCLGDGN